MKKQNLRSKITAFTLLFLTSVPVFADVWRVNYNPTFAQWANHQVFSGATGLQQAINSPSVNSGDTIYIEASSTPYSAATITNKKLTIIGTGYFLSDNANLQANLTPSTIATLTFGIGSDSSSVMGITTPTGIGAGIYLSNNSISNITIKRCRILNELKFLSSAGINYNNIIIEQNFINSFNTGGGAVNGLIITNNYFVGAFAIGINVLSGSAAQNVIQGNLNINGFTFYNNIVLGSTITQNNNSSANIYYNIFDFGQPAWLGGGNNYFGLNSSYIFISGGSIDSMYTVAASCSECFQGFPGGISQIGMFGGNNPYRLSGIPAIPTIYNLSSPANVPQGGTIPVTISTRSNN
jgi:hypothetical protein